MAEPEEQSAELDPNAGIPPSGPVDESEEVLAAAARVATRSRKAVVRPSSDNPAAIKQLPTVASDEDYAKIAPGSRFLDPDQKVRTKPWLVKSDADFDKVPEGGIFLDPEGKSRKKPKFEALNFTAQTLYDMALTPEGKKKALELQYPGKVKDDKAGPYVDDDGTLRRPGRGGLMTGLAHTTAELAPAAGLIGGAMLGGVTGTAASPAGTVAGGVAGGVLGAMLGQSFNNIMLGLAGIHETLPAQVGAIGNAGLAVAGGELAGKAISAVPAAVAKAKSGTGALAEKVGQFLGVDKAPPGALATAREIAEFGETPATGLLAGPRNALGLTETTTPVRPSATMMHSPKVHLNVETFDPTFRTDKPLDRGAKLYYDEKAGALFDEMGIPRPPSFHDPKASTSTQQAGELLIQRALKDSETADTAMQNLLKTRKDELAAGVAQQTSQREALLETAAKQRQAADELINGAIKDIDQTADKALDVLKARSNTGDFWWLVGEKFKAAHDAIGTAFRRYAGQAYEVAGPTQIPVPNLAPAARDFIRNVPDEFKKRMPTILADIEKLATVDAEKLTGHDSLTFEQLHKIRTMLRAGADWHDLPSDVKNGAFKYLSHEVDAILQSNKNPENIQLAARMLNATDEWYGEKIRVFNNAEVKAVMNGLRGGEPADPERLYQVLVKPNRTDLINEAHKVLGDNLWNGVRAAQTKTWLQKAGTADPNKPDMTKFANEIVDAYHDGTLHAVQGKTAGDELFKLAQMVHTLNGKIDIKPNPGDTAFDIMRKAYLAGEEAAALGKQDPLKVLANETRKLEAEFRLKARTDAKADPFPQLAFLRNKSTGANAAVEKILADEDLIIATEAKFGRDSPEFKALQQVWAEKIFIGATRPGESLKKVSPEIQELMLGHNVETAKKLIDEIVLMRGTRDLAQQTGKSIAATAMVQSPMGTVAGSKSIPGAVLGGTAKVLVPNVVGRAMLEQYWALAQKISTSPGLLRWLEKGLNGGIQDQEAVRQIIRQMAEKYQLGGAAVGLAEEQRRQRK